VTYDGAALGAVQLVPVRAGGDTALHQCDLGALGFAKFRAAPDHSFSVEGGGDTPLVLAVTSGCDAALLARTANGRWLFNDDGNGNLDPRLMIPEGAALEGQVDVWVGSFAGAECDATLQMVQAGVRLPILPPGPGPMAGMPMGAADNTVPMTVQAQAPQPAPLPVPAPVPMPVPAPIPAPIPAPVPAPVPVPATICPNPNLIGPALTVTGAQLLAPQGYVAQAAGLHEVEGCPGIDGWGLFNEAPSFTLYMSEMAGYQFTAEMTSDCDPTMIMRDAYGQWHFNDDGPNGLQPQIQLDGSVLNGRVDIWVGGFAGSACTGTIVLRSAASVSPMPQPGGAAGCPNPALQGVPVTITGSDLYTPKDYYVTAGGMQDVGACGLPVFAAGSFSAQPSLSFFLSGMQEYARLEIQGEAFCDTVLLVRTPDGMWHFDDDSNGGLNPMLNLSNTRMLNGRVDVWVGTYDAGACPATIEMETWAN
jgi:hypothetical protein